MSSPNTQESNNDGQAQNASDLKSKLISIATNNLIILGLLVVFFSEGIVSIKASFIDTQRLSNSNVSLQNTFTVVGIFILFAGIIGKFNGFRNHKYSAIIYSSAGLVTSLLTFFITANTNTTIQRHGINKGLDGTYLWFYINNPAIRTVNLKKYRFAISLHRALDESYRLPIESNESNTELFYFEAKNVEDLLTYYEIPLSKLRDSVKVGDPISFDLYLITNEFAADKNNSLTNIDQNADEKIEKNRCHVSVYTYDFGGIMTILKDYKDKLKPGERDSLSKVLLH